MYKPLPENHYLSRTNNPLAHINQPKFLSKTYRLTFQAVNIIEELVIRLSREAGIELSRSKIMELIIFHARSKSLEELLNLKKPKEVSPPVKE